MFWLISINFTDAAVYDYKSFVYEINISHSPQNFFFSKKFFHTHLYFLSPVAIELPIKMIGAVEAFRSLF